ncbi:Uncharacterised protein [Salmonella enterica subsp. diarizonae]|nr:Uncharacterised protein [Salmonella enterica subsp. diarizonae]
MTKNQMPKITRMPTFDGRELGAQAGLQMAVNGAQVETRGIQMVARPQQGNQIPGYGRQTSAQTTSQGTFCPCEWPEDPADEKIIALKIISDRYHLGESPRILTG